MLVAFVIFLHLKLDVLTLGLTNVFTVLLVILRGSRLHVKILHLKDCAGKFSGVHQKQLIKVHALLI